MLRLRYAPSPTGPQHLGGLRTLLYNYLYAKKMNGQLILRIEDTDSSRTWDGALDNLEKMLRNFSISFDEGPPLNASKEVGGSPTVLSSSKEYFQSERLSHYHKYAEILLKKGYAYRCFCSKERLSSLKWGYDGKCKNTSSHLLFPNGEGVIRFNALSVRRDFVLKKSSIIHKDLIMRFRKDLLDIPLDHCIDNMILLKADLFPTYHLASIVDDHLMRITTVLRGSEWLSSTPLHLYLYASLNIEAPEFGHLPLLLNSYGKKLSKRSTNSFPSLDCLQEKYLPEAIINFISLLGYHQKQGDSEIKDINELISSFSLENIGKNPVIIDEEKLKWFNREHIKRIGEHINIPSFSSEYIKRVISCLNGREDEFSNIREGYFFKHPQPPPLTREEGEHLLRENEEIPKKLMRNIICGYGVSGPPLSEIIEILGEQIVNERIRRAMKEANIEYKK